MNVNLTKREKNPLMHREEIEFEVTDTKNTPSRKEVIAKIAALTNAKPNTVTITKIESTYGSMSAHGQAKVYEDPAFMKTVESEYLAKRGIKEKKEEKEAPKPPKEEGKEAPKEEKKEEAKEAPKEEKKEEKAEEKK
jgi:small subunit ribosomal protein S24e